jgi:hypothetical protein
MRETTLMRSIDQEIFTQKKDRSGNQAINTHIHCSCSTVFPFDTIVAIAAAALGYGVAAATAQRLDL